MNVKNETVLVANDNGYAYHKLAWYVGDVIHTSKVAAAIETGHKNAGANGERINAYSVGDAKYTCGSSTNQLIDLRNASYPISIENRVVFTHAMVKAGLADKKLSACVTLPFRDYYSDGGEINSAFVRKVAANFKENNVEVFSNNSKTLEVVDVQVVPEAMATWFDWAINDDCTMSADYEGMSEVDGEVLVIDIGGSTTDIVSVSMNDGELAYRNDKSGSTKIGVLDAMSELHTVVGSHLESLGVSGASGHGWGLSLKAQDLLMRTGHVRLGGVDYDFTKERDAACANTAQAIINFIESTVGSTLEYFSIVFSGGGSVRFHQWMKQAMPTAIFMDEYANARGALKYNARNQG